MTFYVSRAWRIGFAIAGAVFAANAAFVVIIAPHAAIGWFLFLPALIPLLIAWSETRSPIVEVHPDRLIIRTARLRPFEVPRPSEPLIVERGPVGLGWLVRSASGRPWVTVPMFLSRRPTHTLHIGRILGPDNDRLGAALRTWATEVPRT